MTLRRPIKQYSKPCEWCGGLIERAGAHTFAIRKYCSRACSALAQRISEEDSKQCEQCGAEFRSTRKPGELKDRRFCSPACARLAQQNQIPDLLKRVRIIPSTGCHLWTGPVLEKGYGQARLRGRNVLVHRAVWEHFRGPVPEGLQLDHTCGNKACCNCDHLRAVTARVNSLADTSNNAGAKNFRKLVCPKCGGPFSARSNGNRFCRPCWNAGAMLRQRERRARKRAEK